MPEVKLSSYFGAGTIDLVVIDGRSLHIFDYKTKEIDILGLESAGLMKRVMSPYKEMLDEG
jgi:ATP-dependent exoDNAse (exonuclease V) beta subunit